MPQNIGDQRSQAPNIVRFGTPFKPFTLSVPINFSASGNNTLVSGVANAQIFVYRMLFVTGGATNLIVQDGASTALTGAMPFGTNGSCALDMQGEPWFVTSAGNAFVLNSSSGVQVSGVLYYLQA